MKHLSIFVVTSLIFFSLPLGVFATSTPATPSATTPTITQSPSTNSTNSGDLVKQIKNMVKENLDATVNNLEQQINLKTLVARIGTIKSITSTGITLESDGNLVQVSVTEKSKIIKSKNTTKLSSLAIGDNLLVIGTLLKDDVITAKSISVILEDPNMVTSDAIVAEVITIDSKKKLITLQKGKDQTTYSLSKKSTIKIEDIKPGQTLFVITKLYQGKNSLSRAKIL